jgi:hypothetical protein
VAPTKEHQSPSALLVLERWFKRKHLRGSAREDLDLSSLPAEDADLVSTIMRQFAANGGRLSSVHKARIAWPCAFCGKTIRQGRQYVSLTLLQSANERYCMACAKSESLMAVDPT